MPQVRLYFTDIAQKKTGKSLVYQSPWLANDLETSSVKFDYCFPLLLETFPGHLDHIELQTDKQNSITYCLRLYQIPNISRTDRYDIY